MHTPTVEHVRADRTGALVARNTAISQSRIDSAGARFNREHSNQPSRRKILNCKVCTFLPELGLLNVTEIAPRDSDSPAPR